MQKFAITKKIARSGKNNIIVIPTILKQVLKAGTVVKLDIEVINLEGAENE
ncbi:hypothetical protein GF343_04760 [Candidatus Woesearchaeota archaeon]|nr:hypothetical protein [Candidatus Woesearchaeota archaeon]